MLTNVIYGYLVAHLKSLKVTFVGQGNVKFMYHRYAKYEKKSIAVIEILQKRSNYN